MKFRPCRWLKILRRLIGRARAIRKEAQEIRESLEEIGDAVSDSIGEVSAELHGDPAPKREEDRSGSACATVTDEDLDVIGNDWMEGT